MEDWPSIRSSTRRKKKIVLVSDKSKHSQPPVSTSQPSNSQPGNIPQSNTEEIKDLDQSLSSDSIDIATEPLVRTPVRNLRGEKGAPGPMGPRGPPGHSEFLFRSVTVNPKSGSDTRGVREGQSCRTLSRGLELLHSGDTLILYSGTYDTLEFKSIPGYVIGYGQVKVKTCNLSNIKNVRFRGILFENVTIADCSHIIFEDCVFQSNVCHKIGFTLNLFLSNVDIQICSCRFLISNPEKAARSLYITGMHGRVRVFQCTFEITGSASALAEISSYEKNTLDICVSHCYVDMSRSLVCTGVLCVKSKTDSCIVQSTLKGPNIIAGETTILNTTLLQ